MIRYWHRFVLIACGLCVFFAGMPTGRADEVDKKACASAFASAQRQMRGGALLEAKKSLLICGGPQCPVAMHADCQHWLSSVEASISTVVFRISAAAGPPPSEVTFSVDGGEAARLDGRAVSVDPGAHKVRFEAHGYQSTTNHLVVSEGEKLRNEFITLVPLVEVHRDGTGMRLGQADPILAPDNGAQPRRFTLPVVIASSVAVVGGIGAVYFGMKARSDDRQLEKCTPSCTRDRVDQVKREYLWTNLSIGLAAAGITTATILFILNGRSGSLANKSTSATLGIGVGSSGVGPIMTGRF